MTAAHHTPLLTVEEYLAAEVRAEVRHEYLGGNVYAMSGGTTAHSAVATNFLGLIHNRLRGKPCRPYNSDMKLRVRMPTHTRFYYPDAMVVCNPHPPHHSFQDQPVLVTEVLSRSTRRTDEGEKRDAYLSISSLMVYFLIEVDRPRVLVYRRNERGGFDTEFHEGLEAVVPLSEIGATLPLAELYEGIDFARAAAELKAEARAEGYETEDDPA